MAALLLVTRLKVALGKTLQVATAAIKAHMEATIKAPAVDVEGDGDGIRHCRMRNISHRKAALLVQTQCECFLSRFICL